MENWIFLLNYFLFLKSFSLCRLHWTFNKGISDKPPFLFFFNEEKKMLRETLKSLSTDIFIQRKLITQPALKARFPQFYFPLQTAFFFKVDTAWEPKRAIEPCEHTATCLAHAQSFVDSHRASPGAPAALELHPQGAVMHKSVSKGRKWVRQVKMIQLRCKLHWRFHELLENDLFYCFFWFAWSLTWQSGQAPYWWAL